MSNVMNVEWDYSERAASYDKRAEYSETAIKELLQCTGTTAGKKVADIGAGTAKLSKQLAANGLNVHSVEPNEAMMSFGVKNTNGMNVTWYKGTGEHTGLPDAAFHAAFFGSSFNVVDQQVTLREVGRLLVPRGYFSCMWNHRDLNDPLQKEIEALIKKEVPSYDYGTRRQDPTSVINASKLFGPVSFIEDRFMANMPASEFFEGWKSHATLERQAGSKMSSIISNIELLLKGKELVEVPYSTRIWFAKLNP